MQLGLRDFITDDVDGDGSGDCDEGDDEADDDGDGDDDGGGGDDEGGGDDNDEPESRTSTYGLREREAATIGPRPSLSDD